MWRKMVQIGIVALALMLVAVVGQSQNQILNREFNIASQLNGGIKMQTAQQTLGEKIIQKETFEQPCITKNANGNQVVGCNLSTACQFIFLLALLVPALCLLWDGLSSFIGKKDNIFPSCSTPANRSPATILKISSGLIFSIVLMVQIYSTGAHF